YSATQLIKTDSAAGKRGSARSVKLSEREWDETVQKLAAAFGVRSRQRGIAAFKGANTSTRSKIPAAEGYEVIPMGQVSPLQEDETRFYATAVIDKSYCHLKLATVSWQKEPLESWLGARQTPDSQGNVTPYARYTLPTILGGCIDDMWTTT